MKILPVCALVLLLLSGAARAEEYDFSSGPIQPVAPYGQFGIDVMRGRVPGWVGIHRFGRNPDVGTASTEDIWDAGGSIIFSSQPVRVRIASGGGAQDDPLGSGAGTVTVMGLDANWDLYQENIVTSGTSAGPLSTGHFMRVYNVFVATTGVAASYSSPSANSSTMTVVSSSGNVMAAVYSGMGQSHTTLFTVPRGYTCYLLMVDGSVGSNKASDLFLYIRPAAWDASGALAGSKRVIWAADSIVSSYFHEFPIPIRLEPMTDIWGSVTTGGGGSSETSMDYDLACKTP